MSLVGTDPHTTEHYKMARLRESLAGGSAEELVQDIMDGTGAFQAALVEIEAWYGGEERQLERHEKDILTWPKIDNAKATDKLKKFALKLRSTLVNMKSCGIAPGRELYLAATQKIPPTLLLRYFELHEDRNCDVCNFADWLLNLVHMLRKVEERQAETHKTPTSTAVLQKSQSRHDHRPHRTLATTAGNETPKARCKKCGEGHGLADCRAFATLSTADRWKFVKPLNVCTCCLRVAGHRSAECRSNPCAKCGGKHHDMLHIVRQQQSYSRKTDKEPASMNQSNRLDSPQRGGGLREKPQRPSDTAATATATTCTANTGVHVAFMTVPVKLQHQDRTYDAVALIDSASSTSYIRADVAESLGVSGPDEQLTTSVLGGTTVTGRRQRVNLTIHSHDGDYSTAFQAWTQPDITAPLPAVDWHQMSQQFPHLQQLPLPQVDSRQVDILIGIDVIDVHRVLEEATGRAGEPIARRLPLGWVCFGPVDMPTGATSECTLHTSAVCEPLLDTLVAKFWEDDQVGMQPQSDKTMAEIEAEHLVADRMKIADGHVTTGIPWIRPDHQPQLPPNRAMAEKRLISLERSLLKKPDIQAEYDRVFQSYIDKGYVVRCEDSAARDGDQWLLPHFPVVRHDKATTKVRVVFDAAARQRGVSLNDEMYTGPKLQHDLIHVLLRFCREPVAIVGDIAEMFLQVQLQQQDRRYVRFLWRKSTDKQPSIYEFTRLVFGLKASPFIACRALKEVAAQHGEQYDSAARAAVEESFYVDDFLNSQPSVPAGISVRQGVQDLLHMGSFHLRKWRSNSRDVLRSIPEADRAADALVSIDDCSDAASAAVVKTLGVVWDALSDTFSYRYNTPDDQRLTKRSVLSKMASIYDPRGHISPFTIRARLLFQEACILGCSWDDRLPSELETKWQRWFAELPDLAGIKVPRCFKSMERQADTAKLTVHTFTDASAHATSAVSYVRAAYPDGFVKVSLAFAKARATPIKKVTIPKLELRGAVLGLRTSKVVSQALAIPVAEHVFWTDSLNVVYWVRSHAKNFTSDVACRVGEIQADTKASQWRHVPGVLNPADFPSRGMKVLDLVGRHTWWSGPDFLTRPEAEWPLVELATPPQLPGELKKKPCMTFASQVTPSRLDPATYSTWERLTRVTAWCLRFVQNARRQTATVTRGETHVDTANTSAPLVYVRLASGHKPRSVVTVPVLTAAEVAGAERHWFAQAQLSAYPATLKRLRAGEELPPSDPLYRLNAVLDATSHPALMVVNGRLKHAVNLPVGVRQPVILPQRHRVTTLLIQREDDLCCHGVGTQHLLSNLRQRFWIVHGTSAIKSVRAQCVTCSRLMSKAAEQIMGPLPNHRTCGSLKPFTRCGVDYAGPFYTKQGRGRAQQKRYMCVFTCLETRACHLEMAFFLDTEEFLMAFSRFIKRRGTPSIMVSDNGTNFTGAERELREASEAIDRTQVSRKFAHEGIEWRFNPPRAPHFGGVFEIVVKAAKRAITTVLANASLTDEELLTALIEAEHLINTRPLTTVSDDAQDDQPLTPQHFLVGRMDAPLAKEVTVLGEHQHQRKRWAAVQRLVDDVWQRWKREFLQSLNLRKCWRQAKKSLKVGDVVMWMSPGTPRGEWPLGRIMETFPGKDNKVRVVDVKIGGKILQRAIHHLVPLPVGNE